MSENDDIELLAFEFVLGTLPHAERVSIAARRTREAGLDAAITYWERRLTELSEFSEPVAPAPDLLPRIEARIKASASRPDIGTLSQDRSEVPILRRQLARWRASAIAAYALAATVVGVFVTNEVFFLRDEPDTRQQYFAVFNEDDNPPEFLLSIDLQSRELTIRPIAAEATAGKSYQLWIASDAIDDSPQSLGLLDETTAPTRRQLAGFDAELLERATFGISLEPEGGSTTGKPSGPALHGTLHPASQ